MTDLMSKEVLRFVFRHHRLVREWERHLGSVEGGAGRMGEWRSCSSQQSLKLPCTVSVEDQAYLGEHQ